MKAKFTEMQLILIVACTVPLGTGFAPLFHNARLIQGGTRRSPQKLLVLQQASTTPQEEEDDDDDEKPENPYADPKYPDLEFVNYDDPEYSSLDTNDDEFYAGSVEEEIEEMREDRRKRNDEYQFQTYFTKTWQNGVDYKGDWTIYKTDTFLQNDNTAVDDDQAISAPRLLRAAKSLQVTARAIKSDAVDGDELSSQQRIVHQEVPKVAPPQVSDDEEEEEFDQPGTLSSTAVRTEREILSNRYWPDELAPFDFRGHQGIMVCGNAWTVCTAVPFRRNENDDDDQFTGPFKEYRAELGVHYGTMRMRVKFDYSVLDKKQQVEISSMPAPPLHLKSMTVCRETNDDGTWPRATKDESIWNALFGLPGASGGLYDPPPVGGDVQAGRYMMLDLEGHATVMFPYRMDQDPDAFEEATNGWVMSLDWTPGKNRFQVDRKVHGGAGILGLRTLELSEVQSADADTYRASDGGQDMRQ